MVKYLLEGLWKITVRKERFEIMALKLLEPILIGGSLAKNRIVMAPMETRLSTITGDITQAMIDYYAQRAKGGAGVIIVENTFIDNLASRASLEFFRTVFRSSYSR